MNQLLPAEYDLVRGASNYPARLAELRNPPLRVRVRGAFEEDTRCVAIVGTRRADPEALEFTHSLARELAVAGITVVSGGAIGVDAAAHEGALAGGGATLAVLANGFEPPYPPKNASLFARIAAERGALMSEMDDGVPPTNYWLLRRNELVAALSVAVVVVQAPRVSGALSTAAVAKRLGRHVFAVPSSPWDSRGEGSLALVRAGARICVGASDVLSVCPPGRPLGGFPEAPTHLASDGTIDLDDDERLVLGALASKPRHVDELVRSTEISVGRVQRALMVLLLAGRVDERDGGRYVRAPRMR